MGVSEIRKADRRAAGFTLIELLVVVLIIGILASIAIPQYFKVVEKGKLVEAHAWIGNVRSSQERSFNSQGAYVDLAGISSLDIEFTGSAPTYGMKYFNVDTMVATGTGCDDGFTVTLKRINTGKVKAPSRYKDYSVQYDSCVGQIKYPSCTPCDSDFK